MAPTTSLIHSIVVDAEKRITALRIQSTSSLMTFLKMECKQKGVPFRETYDEVLRCGFLAHLGKLYRAKLENAIKAARVAITRGNIVSDDELRESLEMLASTIKGDKPFEKVYNDLLIDARLHGLYELLPDAEECAGARLDLIARAA